MHTVRIAIPRALEESALRLSALSCGGATLYPARGAWIDARGSLELEDISMLEVAGSLESLHTLEALSMDLLSSRGESAIYLDRGSRGGASILDLDSASIEHALRSSLEGASIEVRSSILLSLEYHALRSSLPSIELLDSSLYLHIEESKIDALEGGALDRERLSSLYRSISSEIDALEGEPGAAPLLDRARYLEHRLEEMLELSRERAASLEDLREALSRLSRELEESERLPLDALSSRIEEILPSRIELEEIHSSIASSSIPLLDIEAALLEESLDLQRKARELHARAEELESIDPESAPAIDALWKSIHVARAYGERER